MSVCVRLLTLLLLPFLLAVVDPSSCSDRFARAVSLRGPRYPLWSTRPGTCSRDSTAYLPSVLGILLLFRLLSLALPLVKGWRACQRNGQNAFEMPSSAIGH